MQKALESEAVKRTICRRRLEQGREASGSPREDGGSMGAWPVKDSSGVLGAPCGSTGWSAEVSCCSLTFFLCLQLLCSPCSGLNNTKDRLGHPPLSSSTERSAFLKPRRRRGVESCQSQGISQAGALRSTESWERRGRTARGFPWASKHLSCTATGFIITLLPRLQFAETAWF